MYDTWSAEQQLNCNMMYVVTVQYAVHVEKKTTTVR